MLSLLLHCNKQQVHFKYEYEVKHNYQDTIKLLKGFAIYKKQINDSCFSIDRDTINRIIEIEDSSWVIEIRRNNRKIFYNNLKEVFVRPTQIVQKGYLLGRLRKNENEPPYLLEVVFSDHQGKISYKY